ncbi:hypothetical protein ACH4PW_36620 [Streptomyces sp. NPDC017082]
MVESWDLTAGGAGKLLHIRFDVDGAAVLDCFSESVDQDFIEPFSS